MGMSMRFMRPVDGAGGRVDPMRVLTHSGYQPNDLSDEVMFSGLWPAMYYDWAQWRLDVNAAADFTWQPQWDSGRQFITYPNLHMVYIRDDGGITYPYVRSLNNRPTQASTTYSLDGMARLQGEVVHRGGNVFSVQVIMQQINYREFISGYLRMFLIGRGMN
ncbi:hypothetical protein [Methylobacterium oxalidis]|uniref:Uncharacterized protein n=1 Tax=Methylobacterium oxalidis TaxID=944322 RepID=A0A512J6G7_9HYPH|nr:hypothetical protein [Methylobacterium oxalidis]GEP05574.1 hypothetical protein MOX02_36120 [Methylobacterium oxalidis]GJE32699.1 hypothetical protein LDDCCGHA_2887 [Methylobacterium oxalidis]GLS65445.1 hypothetical protein GCM10007888_38270 [Methylobacterium oxalidis]